MALPTVIAVVTALALLGALAVFDAVQESRVASLAGDRVEARAALLEGIAAASNPPSVVALCVQPPLAAMTRSGASVGRGRYGVVWRHLGRGLMLAEVEGRGVRGARARLRLLLRPDSGAVVSGLYSCPAAQRLLPAEPEATEWHPEG
jgi:hypothetical protein